MELTWYHSINIHQSVLVLYAEGWKEVPGHKGIVSALIFCLSQASTCLKIRKELLIWLCNWAHHVLKSNVWSIGMIQVPATLQQFGVLPTVPSFMALLVPFNHLQWKCLEKHAVRWCFTDFPPYFTMVHRLIIYLGSIKLPGGTKTSSDCSCQSTAPHRWSEHMGT